MISAVPNARMLRRCFLVRCLLKFLACLPKADSLLPEDERCAHAWATARGVAVRDERNRCGMSGGVRQTAGRARRGEISGCWISRPFHRIATIRTVMRDTL